MGHIRLLRRAPRAWLAALTASVLTAAAASALAQTAPQTIIRLSLEERLEGPAAFFFLPQDKGYFRNEGLDVAIEQAGTAIDPITRVASGNADLGFADINALIRYRDRNPGTPVKAIFIVYNQPPFAVIGRKSRGIVDPHSLEGKTLGASQAGATYDQWPIFAKLNGINPAKVMIESIGIPVRAPMLAAGQIDAVLGYSFRVYVDLKDRGVPIDDITLLPMARYGLKLYGSAIIANTRFAAEKPEAVTAFLVAFTRGLKETISNPSGAVNAGFERDDLGKKEVALERLRMAIRDNVVTPEVRADGLGAVDSARLAQAIDQIALAHPFKVKPKPEDVFDPAFLPSAAARKLD